MGRVSVNSTSEIERLTAMRLAHGLGHADKAGTQINQGRVRSQLRGKDGVEARHHIHAFKPTGSRLSTWTRSVPMLWLVYSRRCTSTCDAARCAAKVSSTVW